MNIECVDIGDGEKIELFLCSLRAYFGAFSRSPFARRLFFNLILFVPSENLPLNVPKEKYQFKILIYDEKSLFLHL